MKVKIILKSKEGLCVERDKIDRIAMTDDMILLEYNFKGIDYIEELKKDNIRYIKVIQERNRILERSWKWQLNKY